jgi:two-component system, cell cycle response regulator DivK
MKPSEAKIIYVEDNDDNALVVSFYLEDLQVQQFITVPSGRKLFSALGEFKNGHVDLILLDIQIPKEDGYYIIEQIRSDHRLKQTKVVALTANIMHTDILKLRAAGFDGLIGKPIEKIRFYSQVTRILAGEPIWEVR